MTNGFTRRGWLLFGAMAILWGLPYLFIKEAVDTIAPAAVVCGRTLIGALVLLPFAIRSGALRTALKHWPWVLAFGLIEMAVPFLLLGTAEQTLPSGLTGLLVATVPLFGTLIAIGGGDRTAVRPLRIIGLLLGFAGVAVVVYGSGIGTSGTAALWAVGMVLTVGLFYAIAPFVIDRKLRDVPSIGSITLALLMIGIGYLPAALMTQHQLPSLRSGGSLLLLGLLCTALAFLAFFALIREVGPVNAPLFTYINPVVALLLGSLLLGEHLGVGLLIGAPIVLVGCWLAATGGRLRPRRTAPVSPEDEAVEVR
ncbi:DMT family transporter [Microbacterium gorillae]|uniref:DMT family transporter n=1 Tax=Microbacterium gorillae TaxID=1231063 RepID=UPI00058F0DD2|nr:DMT family transporter [Microbacterium gorillae]